METTRCLAMIPFFTHGSRRGLISRKYSMNAHAVNETTNKYVTIFFFIFYYNTLCLLCMGRISLVVINSSIIAERGSSFGLAVELLEKNVRTIHIINKVQLNVTF